MHRFILFLAALAAIATVANATKGETVDCEHHPGVSITYKKVCCYNYIFKVLIPHEQKDFSLRNHT